jgi:hypothetical protein
MLRASLAVVQAELIQKAEELKIVGKDAPSQIRLPHPDECEADHPYHPFLFPPRA